jgi:hypothetical protein
MKSLKPIQSGDGNAQAQTNFMQIIFCKSTCTLVRLYVIILVILIRALDIIGETSNYRLTSADSVFY